jgi:hypothetical protein
LIKGLLALVVGGFTASCADKDGDYVPVGQQKATAYADAFKELIGGEVAPNHDWGFTKTSIVSETSQARTRVAETNSNEWFTGTNPKFAGLVKPADVTDREEEVVTKWFKDNRNPSSDPISLSTFFVQQVHFGDKVYTAIGNNNTEYSVVGGNQMDWLCAYSDTEREVLNYYPYEERAKSVEGHDDHINNFNTSEPKRDDPDNSDGFHNMQLMMYSSTARFGFQESFNSQNDRIYYNYVLKAIEVDGVVGYYVGFDYESHGNQGDFNPDGYYDDRIVKIVPGNGIYEYTPGGGSSSSSTSTRTDRIERRRLVSQGRIFCEDLGTDAARMTKSDIDFNDAVFDAKIWRLGQYDVTYVNGTYSSETDYLTGIYPNGLENGKFKYVAEIRLLAAGGTVPLKIGGNYGFEIHSKFGEGNNRTITHTTIINTMGAPSQANFSTTVSTETCDAVTVEVDITSLVAGKSEIGLDIIPIDVEWVSQTGQSVGELTADFGKVPQKLCVPIGTPWIYERIPITDAYKDFASYATSRTPLFWDGTKNESLLYPSIPEGMTAETGETGDVNTNPYHDRVVTEGQTVTETITETILWEGELAFAENTNGSDFTPSTLSFNEGDYIRIYGSTTNSSNNRVQIAFVDNTTNGWLTKKPYDQTNVNFTNGYVEGTLDATDISNLAGVTKFGVWGINVTITKISKVVKTRTTN